MKFFDIKMEENLWTHTITNNNKFAFSMILQITNIINLYASKITEFDTDLDICLLTPKYTVVNCKELSLRLLNLVI